MVEVVRIQADFILLATRYSWMVYIHITWPYYEAMGVNWNINIKKYHQLENLNIIEHR